MRYGKLAPMIGLVTRSSSSTPTSGSEAATGVPFVRHWVHTGTVYMAGEKMSKSLGNLAFVDDVIQRHHPLRLREFILRRHYRQDWGFDEPATAPADGEPGAVDGPAAAEEPAKKTPWWKREIGGGKEPSDRIEDLILGPADMSASLGLPTVTAGAPIPGYDNLDHFHYVLTHINIAARARNLSWPSNLIPMIPLAGFTLPC